MVFFMSEIFFESVTLIFHCFSCCILHAKLSLHFVTLSFFRKFDAHILNLLLCILLAETIQLAEAIVILRVRSLTITGKILSRIEGEWTTMGYKIEDFHLVIELKVDNKQRIEIIKFVETVTYQTVDLFLEKGEYVHYVPLYWPKKSLFSFQIPRVFIHVFVELIFQKVKMVIVPHLLVGMRLRSPGSSGW